MKKDLEGKSCSAVRVLVHNEAPNSLKIWPGMPGQIKEVREKSAYYPWDHAQVSFPVEGIELNFIFPLHLIGQYVEIE